MTIRPRPSLFGRLLCGLLPSVDVLVETRETTRHRWETLGTFRLGCGAVKGYSPFHEGGAASYAEGCCEGAALGRHVLRAVGGEEGEGRLSVVDASGSLLAGRPELQWRPQAWSEWLPPSQECFEWRHRAFRDADTTYQKAIAWFRGWCVETYEDSSPYLSTQRRCKTYDGREVKDLDVYIGYLDVNEVWGRSKFAPTLKNRIICDWFTYCIGECESDKRSESQGSRGAAHEIGPRSSRPPLRIFSARALFLASPRSVGGAQQQGLVLVREISDSSLRHVKG